MAKQKYWNWQQDEWPIFSFDPRNYVREENMFLAESGVVVGAYRHINAEDKLSLLIECLSSEAVTSSEIEGEFLNRDSVQSSIQREFGLATDHRKVKPAEAGIAKMMVDLFQNFSVPLTHERLFKWHSMLMSGRQDVDDIGKYRTHDEPMRVVSGAIGNPNIHFEAPPSNSVTKQMQCFIDWYNRTGPTGKTPLTALVRASVVHLYFVCIHPFEDGNGRIGRALAEKSLAQSLGKPTLIALSETILKNRKDYYAALEQHNKSLKIDGWIKYFVSTIIVAQTRTLDVIEFIIQKTKFLDRYKSELNVRQTKVLVRMFREGPNGFTGGLSAENYLSITKTSRATATRDLVDLVAMGAMSKTGVGKGTRYHLKLHH